MIPLHRNGIASFVFLGDGYHIAIVFGEPSRVDLDAFGFLVFCWLNREFRLNDE